MKWNYCLDKIPDSDRPILEFQACCCPECINLPVNKRKLIDGHGVLTRNKRNDTQEQWDSYVKWICKEGHAKGYTFYGFWWIYLDEIDLPETKGRNPWDKNDECCEKCDCKECFYCCR